MPDLNFSRGAPRFKLCLILLIGTVAPCKASILIDDFSDFAFSLNGVESQYTSHFISSSDIKTPLRYVGHLVLSNSGQTPISTWCDGQLHVSSIGDIDTQVAIAYGRDLMPSTPSSGSGTLTSLDILPFEPLLDLSNAESLRLYLHTDVPSLSLTLGMLDGITRHMQIVQVLATPLDRFIDVPISEFGQISHSGIGQVFFQTNLIGISNTSFTRFEIVSEPIGLSVFGLSIIAFKKRKSKF